LTCSASSIKSEAELDLMLQPVYSFEENGDWKSESTNGFDINTAKVSIKLSQSSDKLNHSGELKIDFTEETITDMLKRAWYGIEFSNGSLLKVGRFKSSFGIESNIGSKRMPLIERGEVTDFMRDDISIAGNQIGVEFSSKIGTLFGYSATLFNYNYFTPTGGDIRAQVNKFLPLPIVTLECYLSDISTITYSAAVPYTGTVLSDHTVYGKRYLYQNIGVSVDYKRYSGVVELLLAPDTADYKELNHYLEYDEPVSQAISFLNSFSFPLKNNKSLSIHNRFEYLNGLNFNGFFYENRSYNFTVTSGIKYRHKKGLFIDFNVDDKYDNSYKSIDELRYTVQLSGSFKIKRGN